MENLIEAARLYAKAQELNITFDVGDMTSLPYHDNVFDKIFCLWNAYNEIFNENDQVKILTETYRVLKSGGKAFFVLRDGETEEIKKLTAEGKFDPYNPVMSAPLHGVVVHQYLYTRDMLRKLVESSPFKKYTIEFIAMHKRQRILMTLSK